MMQQAEDFHDVITAAIALPRVDPKRVMMWGVDHGASAFMIAGNNNPPIKAVVMQAPFPPGTLDCLNYPAGLREREEMTRARKTSSTYVKVLRDRQEDRDGDDATVFRQRSDRIPLDAGQQGARRSDQYSLGEPSDTAIVPERRELQIPDHVHRIRVPALHMINEAGPFAAPPTGHRVIVNRMVGSAEFRVILADRVGTCSSNSTRGVRIQIEWLQGVL